MSMHEYRTSKYQTIYMHYISNLKREIIGVIRPHKLRSNMVPYVQCHK